MKGDAMKKILVPLDGSGFAEEVLPHAEELARSEGAEILLVRVPVIPTSVFVSQDPTLMTLAVNDTFREAATYIDHEAAKLNQEGLRATGITPSSGMIAETILAAADETHADVIVMSTHARTGLQRLLRGSVADQIVHKTHIPVVLVHPN